MSFAFFLRDTEALPIPVKASKADIILYGERVREQANIINGFDLDHFVQANGGQIISQGPHSGGNHSRAFEMSPDGHFKIYVSSLRSALSNHMIVASELGHRVLHLAAFKAAHPDKTMVVPKQSEGLEDDLHRCKWESAWFAQGLLMPEREFMMAVETRGLENAAALFAVTQEAAMSRHTKILSTRDAQAAYEKTQRAFDAEIS